MSRVLTAPLTGEQELRGEDPFTKLMNSEAPHSVGPGMYLVTAGDKAGMADRSWHRCTMFSLGIDGMGSGEPAPSYFMQSKTPRIGGGPPEHKVTIREDEWAEDWTQGERFTTQEEKIKRIIRERAERQRRRRVRERAGWVTVEQKKEAT